MFKKLKKWIKKAGRKVADFFTNNSGNSNKARTTKPSNSPRVQAPSQQQTHNVFDSFKSAFEKNSGSSKGRKQSDSFSKIGRTSWERAVSKRPQVKSSMEAGRANSAKAFTVATEQKTLQKGYKETAKKLKKTAKTTQKKVLNKSPGAEWRKRGGYSDSKYSKLTTKPYESILYEQKKHPKLYAGADDLLKGSAASGFGLAEKYAAPEAKKLLATAEKRKTKSDKAFGTAVGLAGNLLTYGAASGLTKGAGEKLATKLLPKTLAKGGAKAKIAKTLAEDAILDSTLGAAQSASAALQAKKGERAKEFAKQQGLNYLIGGVADVGAPIAGKAVKTATDKLTDTKGAVDLGKKAIKQAEKVEKNNASKNAVKSVRKGMDNTKEFSTVRKIVGDIKTTNAENALKKDVQGADGTQTVKLNKSKLKKLGKPVGNAENAAENTAKTVETPVKAIRQAEPETAKVNELRNPANASTATKYGKRIVEARNDVAKYEKAIKNIESDPETWADSAKRDDTLNYLKGRHERALKRLGKAMNKAPDETFTQVAKKTPDAESTVNYLRSDLTGADQSRAIAIRKDLEKGNNEIKKLEKLKESRIKAGENLSADDEKAINSQIKSLEEGQTSKRKSYYQYLNDDGKAKVAIDNANQKLKSLSRDRDDLDNAWIESVNNTSDTEAARVLNQKHNELVDKWKSEYDEAVRNRDRLKKSLTQKAADNKTYTTKNGLVFDREGAMDDSVIRVVDDIRDLVGAEKKKPTLAKKLSTVKPRLQEKFVDSLHAFEDEARKIMVSDPESANRMLAETNALRNSDATANQSIVGTQLDAHMRPVKDGTSLVNLYKGLSKDEEEAFDTYLLMRHVPEREKYEKPIFGKDEGGIKKYVQVGREESNAFKIDPQKAQEIASELEQAHPDFKERAEGVYRFVRQELRNRVDAGLMTAEDMNKLIKKYPNYVPTHRAGYDLGDGRIYTAEGSARDIFAIKDQLESMVHKNWRDITANNLLRENFSKAQVEYLKESGDDPLDALLDNTVLCTKTHNQSYSAYGKSANNYYVTYWEKGHKRRVEISEDMYNGLRDHYANGRLGNVLDDINEPLTKVAKVWKSLITDWSPIFMVKNGMRDFPEAIINSKDSTMFLKSMGEARDELINKGKYYHALMNTGVANATFVDLKDGLKEPTGVDKFFDEFFGKLHAGNEMVEMFPRMTEFIGTIHGYGYTIDNVPDDILQIAARNANDVTVNFGRSGSWGKFINKGIVPFFNPSIQGWSKFFRNFSESPSLQNTLEFTARATALGAGPLVISNFLYGDNENYQMISARDKASNYIIAIPPWSHDTEYFVKIPKSRFASVYGLPFVNLNNKNKASWAELIKVANDQIAPVSPLDSNIFSQLYNTKLFNTDETGKTWYGSPIESDWMQSVPAAERYDANTSGISKALGKALHLSPKKLDYLIDAETGVVGDVFLPVTTKAKQGGTLKYAQPFLNIPKRAFTIDAAMQNDVQSRFYTNIEKLKQKSNSANATKADKEAYKNMLAVQNRSGEITNAIRTLQNSNRADKQERIRGLTKYRNKMMNSALEGKDTATKYEDMKVVHKYTSNTYTIKHYGTTADQNAMKAYARSVYGASGKGIKKAINGDKQFYKGFEAIQKTKAQFEKRGLNTNSSLTTAVALASVKANKNVHGAYGTTVASRNETASKQQRAEDYFKNGGSVNEYMQAVEVVKNGGSMTEKSEKTAMKKLNKKLSSGAITQEQYTVEAKRIQHSTATMSYIGKATELARAGASNRLYVLYDIKDKNVRKGRNLAAMGITARSFKSMKDKADTDGNGYLKKAEIIAYVKSSKYQDKATLYDAMYSWNSKRNPFGAVTNYSMEEARRVGKANGAKQIKSDKSGDASKLPEAKTNASPSGYHRRYHRRSYRRYSRRSGGSSKAKTPSTSKYTSKKKWKVQKAKLSEIPKEISTPKYQSLLSGVVNNQMPAAQFGLNEQEVAKLKPPTPKKRA